MDMAAILFDGAEPFEQIDNTPSTEGLRRKKNSFVSSNMLKKIWSVGRRNFYFFIFLFFFFSRKEYGRPVILLK